MKCVLLVASLLVSLSSAIQFAGNISFNANNNGWSYRDVDVLAVGGIGIQQVYYTSNSVAANSQSFNVSGVFGAGLFILTQVPYSFATAYAADADWTGGNGGSWQTAGVAASLGYIATVYASIEELDSNNNLVGDPQTLRYGILPGTLTWSKDYVQVNGPLKSASFVGKPHSSSANWYVNITYIGSDVVGVIDLANAIVGPSSFEQIVQINNWPYQNPENHLRLVMYTISGSATASVSAGALISSGSGSSQVYFSAAATAVVDGTVKGVTLSASASSSADVSILNGNAFLLAQVATKYNSPQFTTVTVDFPANAKSITYDPTVGAGQPLPTDNKNSATSVIASSSVVVLAILALLF